MRKTLLTLVSVVALAGCASTGAPAAAPVDDASAARAEQMFERMKALEGTWVSSPDAEMSGVQIDYQVTSAGSAVLETIFPGEPHEMVSLYYLDNGRLVMTHYCAMQNQPFMAARTDTADGTIHFQCERVGNTASHAEPHMHDGVFTLGSDRLHSEWTTYEALQPTGSVVIDLVRGDN